MRPNPTRRLPAVVASLLATTVLVQSAAAQKRAFSIEDLYRVQGVSDVQVAPDGRTIAYVLTTSDFGRAKRQSHVWMANLDGTDARQVTFSDRSENAPRFSPDGTWLAFVSGRGGDTNLYLMPRAGGESRVLTKLTSGVSDPVWSPDSKWLAFATDVYPECGADDGCNRRAGERWREGPLKAHVADTLLYRHWTAWRDGTRTHVFVVSVPGGDVRDVTPGDGDSPVFDVGGGPHYAFSPDSGELAVASKRGANQASSTNSDLWLVSLGDPQAAPRNVTAPNAGSDGTPRYSPDGRWIAYRTQHQAAYESDLFRLALYDRRAGTSRVVSEGFDNWITDFRWTGDSRTIYFLADVEGQTPLHRLDVATGRVSVALAHATMTGFQLVPGDQQVVFVSHAVARPVELFAADLGPSGATNVRALTTHNQALANDVDIRPAETMWVPGALGARVQVFIVKPHGFDPSRKYPLILNVHGGPQQQWTDSFRGDWQVYPGAGYVVAFANPHGSTGYGQAFTAQISGDWGGAVFQDLMKVTDALAALPYVDADRMGAMGWSYGGYMMNWFAGHTTRFKALASMMGLYDLRSFYGATEELWFPEWDLKGTPWTSDLYEKWSPSNAVAEFRTPTLVVTGERDYRVPYTQSLQFFTALQKQGVPSRLVVFSEAGHWPSWYEMGLYYTAHLEWFQKYLGGGGPPWTTEAFVRNAVFDPVTGKRIATK
jgi:dipeptidyl aminopeptidase/acylaminoacyl peptidase